MVNAGQLLPGDPRAKHKGRCFHCGVAFSWKFDLRLKKARCPFCNRYLHKTSYCLRSVRWYQLPGGPKAPGPTRFGKVKHEQISEDPARVAVLGKSAEDVAEAISEPRPRVPVQTLFCRECCFMTTHKIYGSRSICVLCGAQVRS